MRIRRAIERRATLEDQAAAAQRRLLQAAQREILAELRSAGGYRARRLRSILATVDRYIGAGRTVGAQTAAGHAGQAWRLGIELADAGLDGAHLHDLSAELLRSLVKNTRDLVKDAWDGLGTRLKAGVRRVVIGLDDPQEAIAAVAKSIKSSAGWTAAENVVRDRVNATFTDATRERLDQAADAGVKIKKAWLSAEDDRVRPDHAAAARRYPASRPIPVDKAFIVGGEPMMAPHDPSASAAQTRFCRCSLLPVVD